MKSSSVRSISQFASKLHPQVALTRTESKRLLDSLKTSFRQQLDAEHNPDHVQATAVSRGSALNHAEKHVASVLTNPLLATSQIPRPLIPTNDKRHPIDIFTDCAANGVATIHLASQCISAFHRLLKSLTAEKKREEIAKFQPGSKILQWLWATGMAQSEALVSGQRLVSSVVALLLREGKEEAIWKWFTTADHDHLEGASAPNSDQVSAQSLILRQLIYWKVRAWRDDPRGAVEAFTKAIGMVNAGIVPSQSTRPAGVFLLSELKRQTTQVSTSTDSDSIIGFLQSFQTWKQSDLEPHAIDVARLSLQYLGATYLEKALQIATRLDLEEAKSTQDSYGTKVVRYLLTLSEVLQAHGSRDQMHRFVKILQHVQDTSATQHKGSLLAQEIQGLPRLLLQDIKTWSSPLSDPTISPAG
ncbi:hypothetical protein BDZ85DRAFT_257872 [Elsinoe ampelina]|uniref:Uncharacterized protein n=1 Tax=Elsinoe ampelina TaxID=302913 RepID=A0A6A6GJ91_9PEZI|nr:hypothetical protein BDZ85DRAFT_257872 [Elsinoe ampelina]